jgi:hypothetical protein
MHRHKPSNDCAAQLTTAALLPICIFPQSLSERAEDIYRIVSDFMGVPLTEVR